MFTIKITCPDGNIETKKVKGQEATSREVERVTQHLLRNFGGGKVEAFYSDGSSFMSMAF